MDPNLGEWLNLIVRWTHVITGIAWIGTSFFFNWLDSRLTPTETERPGVEGELWLVHSGGFYHVEKRQLAPHELPRRLHWFVWEATFTWLSGILLLAIVYYLGADVYLLDRGVSDIGAGAAIVLGLATLAASWVVYDLVWRAPPAARNPALAAVLCFALLVAVAYGLSQVIGGRAAYIHVGALLGTLMAANVWVHIIPAQREMVAATKQGREADPGLGRHAKRRSLHNNYMTLPVVFIMVSNHYAGTYGHALNWLVLALIALAGAGVRHYFNKRHNGEATAIGWLAAAAGVMVAAFLVAGPPERARQAANAAAGDAVSFAAVRAVVERRCLSCHSATPADKNFAEPPAAVAFDTPEQIANLVERIFARVVVTRTMPLANKTGMTDEERDLVARWIVQGARRDDRTGSRGNDETSGRND
ncbi:MAG: urate hydroxylase PuuD [Alphaproteobacteria bacterium]